MTLLAAAILLQISELSSVQDWMESAFYPVLFIVLLVASLGLPIPEDIPLIAAGVILRTQGEQPPSLERLAATFVVALAGIMAGDLILYMLGKHWGPSAINHRFIRWVVTPERFARMSRKFRKHGTLLCFFGRFLMGVRAAMCVTAGATRFPYWRFFLADFAGALLSIPLFISLGYVFADVLGSLQENMERVQIVLVLVAVVIAIGLFLLYRAKRKRKARWLAELGTAEAIPAVIDSLSKDPPQEPADRAAGESGGKA
jgi:membrane protein DedA with SNARE-associated domain